MWLTSKNEGPRKIIYKVAQALEHLLCQQMTWELVHLQLFDRMLCHVSHSSCQLELAPRDFDFGGLYRPPL